MRHYDLGGLSAMFLDWDPSDCGGESFPALETLNTLTHFFKNGSQFYSLGLNFIMDNKQLEGEIQTDHKRRMDKYNFIRHHFIF